LDVEFVFHLCEFLKFFANMPWIFRFLLVNFTNRCKLWWFFSKNGQNLTYTLLCASKFDTQFGVHLHRGHSAHDFACAPVYLRIARHRRCLHILNFLVS
jgi:hypothetical protein